MGEREQPGNITMHGNAHPACCISRFPCFRFAEACPEVVAWEEKPVSIGCRVSLFLLFYQLYPSSSIACCLFYS